MDHVEGHPEDASVQEERHIPQRVLPVCQLEYSPFGRRERCGDSGADAGPDAVGLRFQGTVHLASLQQ
ncbi:hypothetical protein BJF78_13980 [Pseudonocardia sp. CNS-139]|nr:hypothetical protein BJF78_13980 [Pseudonocardia sp. CNS-139]